MGNMARRIKRGRPTPVTHILTEEEYTQIVNQVKDQLVNSTLYDVLSVVVSILNEDWGKLHRRKTRMHTFGELYLKKFADQCKTHSEEHHDLLLEAGIVVKKGV